MTKPRARTRLRALASATGLVVCLLGLLVPSSPVWAQQEVTLSGRVTDQAGQPFEGAFIFLEQMPGFIFVTGDNTASDGSYRLSAPPGTYRLIVDPNRGPFIPQIIETFTLTGNATRDFDLEEGFTLSGQVTDSSGAPVAQVFLSVSVNDPEFRQVSRGSADNEGRYSLGVPAGTYRINVFSGGRFLDKQIEDVSISQDQTLDITLESGVMISGKVVDQSGQSISCVDIIDDDVMVGLHPESFTSTQNDGSFQLNVPPAILVIRADPPSPLNPTGIQVDTREGDVTGLVLEVSAAPAPFVADMPPRASLIQVSPPDEAGDVRVTGAPGAVSPNSFVVFVTLNTGHYAYTQAETDGSFSASLFAPAGTSILVKADPLGSSVGQFLFNSREGMVTHDLSALPGTIVLVNGPSSTETGFAFAGAGWTHGGGVGESPLPAWTFEGTINSQKLLPGDVLSAQGTFKIVSPALEEADTMQVGVVLTLERLSGPDGLGSLAQNTYSSTVLTPTGLPIERIRRFDNGLSQFVFVNIPKVSADQAEVVVDLSLPLPVDLPAGFYRPYLSFFPLGVPPESPRAAPQPKSAGLDAPRPIVCTFQ